jgi:predicted nucleic acid-binding protein
MSSHTATVPCIVVTEAYSDSRLDDATKVILLSLPILEFFDGYWERAGLLRAATHARGLKANIADCLIAQACIDHDIPLITYDRDFRHFAAAGLQLR